MTDQNEQQIIKAVINGDTEAYKEIVNKHATLIYSVCYRLLGNEDDAKDISQEVFMYGLKSIKSYKGESEFSTWLYAIAVNRSKNMNFRKGILKFLSLDKKIETDDSSLTRELIDNKADVENTVHKNDSEKLLQKHLLMLSDQLRAVVVLRFIENKSYEEIAEICNCPMGTVGSRISRGLNELKKNIEKDIGEKNEL